MMTCLRFGDAPAITHFIERSARGGSIASAADGAKAIGCWMQTVPMGRRALLRRLENLRRETHEFILEDRGEKTPLLRRRKKIRV